MSDLREQWELERDNIRRQIRDAIETNLILRDEQGYGFIANQLLALLDRAGGDISRLAVLDKDQSLPVNPAPDETEGYFYSDGQQGMLKAGFRRIKEKP